MRPANTDHCGCGAAPHALWMFLFLVIPGSAAETCPWMNAATAGGFLGAPAAASDHAACTFSGAGGQIRITVTPLTSAKDFAALKATCGASQTPLRAIGNEAVLCDGEEKHTARIISRVRDQAFTLLIRSSNAAVSPDTLREKARAAAEIIAGNLF